MAEKLGLGTEVRQLKIGQSFTNPKSTAFHTVKYDFKPASVDTNKKATVDVGSNHQVTVTVPHLDGAGVPQTVFKGSQRPYTKECVLVIDRNTGVITLERLGCNIQVKKTRSEFNNRAHLQDRSSQGNDKSSHTSRSNTSPMLGHRVSSKTKVTSGSRRPDRPITHLVPKHSPMHASPSYRSPGHPVRSPKNNVSVNNESHNQSTLASLPMIGIDDFSDPVPVPQNSHHVSHNSYSTLNTNEKSVPNISDNENGVGEMSDSSSSSSDGDSDSDTEVPATNNNNGNAAKTNGYSSTNSSSKIPAHLLNEDLCLSESGSDSE